MGSVSAAILIPSFQPDDRLAALIDLLHARTKRQIVVVDDGSGEAYRPLFDGLGVHERVAVLRNAINLGKGAALKLGFNHLLNEWRYAGIVTADGDGQHSVDDILKVCAEIEEHPNAFVLGARGFGSSTPLRSRIGNAVSRVVYRFLLGKAWRDTQTGLRGVPAMLARRSLAIRSNRYEFESEQLAISAQLNLPLREVDIETIYEDGNRRSHFDPFFDSIRIYFVVLRYAISSIVTWLVDIIAFVAIITVTSDVLIANLSSRILPIFVQFALLRRFVFNSGGGAIRFLLFALYVLAMGTVSAILQVQLSAVTGLHAIAAKLIVETGIFIFNFLFLRDLLFRRNPLELDDD